MFGLDTANVEGRQCTYVKYTMTRKPAKIKQQNLAGLSTSVAVRYCLRLPPVLWPRSQSQVEDCRRQSQQVTAAQGRKAALLGSISTSSMQVEKVQCRHVVLDTALCSSAQWLLRSTCLGMSSLLSDQEYAVTCLHGLCLQPSVSSCCSAVAMCLQNADIFWKPTLAVNGTQLLAALAEDTAAIHVVETVEICVAYDVQY